MNFARGFFGIVFDSYGQDIFVLGGEDGKKKINNCEKYSIDNDSWTKIKPMSKKKSKVSACIFNNVYIYAIGGITEGSNFI